MKKLNIAELLRDCPTGMELDCTMFDNVTLVGVNIEHAFPIEIKVGCDTKYLTKEGCYHLLDCIPSAKCVIFPKGKTTWEGFQKPFKDGDIVATEYGNWIGIVRNKAIDGYKTYFSVNHANLGIYPDSTFYFNRFATKEEKEKLFQAIKDNGYKWNSETKTLEKLVEPKFKVGDKIKNKIGQITYTIIDIRKDEYIVKRDNDRCKYHLAFCNEIDYELVPNKFDISTLKPFDKILVRSKYCDSNKWGAALYSHCSSDGKICGVVGGLYYKQCIPFEGNEHLLGTSNDCDEYYKNW